MTQGPCASRFPALIDRLFLEPLAPAHQRALDQHLEDCPSCRQRYNRLVLAQRVWEGGGVQAAWHPSPQELDRVEVAVLQRTLGASATPAGQRLLWLRWGAALLTTGLALAIVLPLTFRTAGTDRQSIVSNGAGGMGGVGDTVTQFQARGPQPSATGRAGHVAQGGVRVFCIHHGEQGAEVNSLPPTQDPERAGTCQVSDVMRLAYTNRSPLEYLFVFGVDQELRPKWYVPTPPDRDSLRVARQVVDEPLPRAVRLGVNHQPTLIRIVALFSERPIASATVDQWLEQSRVAGRTLTTLNLESLPAGMRHNIWMRLVP